MAAAGPGTFGELDSTGARSVLRRYSDAWFAAAKRRPGSLRVGDPRGVLHIDAGRRHNLRLRQWQIGRLIQILQDKAALAGIAVQLVDERGSSSTCPGCCRRVPKPRGGVWRCAHCDQTGHRDLIADHHRHPHRWRIHHPDSGDTRCRARGGHAPSSRPAPERPDPA